MLEIYIEKIMFIRLKKVFSILVCAVSYFSCACIYAREYHFASIEYLAEQEVGSRVVKKIYQKIGIKVHLYPMPANRAEKSAIQGKMDGEVLRIGHYGDVNPSMVRVPTSFYKLETAVFARNNATISINDKTDLISQNVVVVRGVKHTSLVSMYAKKTTELSSTLHMMDFLSKGRADIALTNSLDGFLEIVRRGHSGISMLRICLAEFDLFHYLHKKHRGIVSTVDDTIKTMIRSGEMSQLIKDSESEVLKFSSIDSDDSRLLIDSRAMRCSSVNKGN